MRRLLRKTELSFTMKTSCKDYVNQEYFCEHCLRQALRTPKAELHFDQTCDTSHGKCFWISIDCMHHIVLINNLATLYL